MYHIVCGAGGFIGGHLVNTLKTLAIKVRAVDKKPISEWHQHSHSDNVENLCLDLSNKENCRRVCEGADVVYNLAADMGGMGFIESHPVECMRNVLINTNLIDEAYKADAERYFFSSSACVYNQELQKTKDYIELRESDAYPAMAERGYGWEKLFSEMVCQEYWNQKKLKTYIARFHNVYGPYGSWCDGREKAPAAICRKVLDVKYGKTDCINVWGDGTQQRSFMYIQDCISGILRIVYSKDLVATPINLGSSRLVSIGQLVNIVENIAGVDADTVYNHNAPKGVQSRNSNNDMIKSIFDWEPDINLEEGLKYTYEWIKEQYNREKNV